MRSATQWLTGCPKSAVMSVPSPLYNQSQVKPSQAPQQFLGTGPGWTLRPPVFGVDASRGLISMSEFSTHMPLPTANNASPQPTENMRIKIRAYEQRVREVEHGSFTPLVMSLTGGCGNAANICYKRLASMLADKRDQPYSTSSPSLCCVLRSNAYAGPALLVATHLDRPSPPSDNMSF